MWEWDDEWMGAEEGGSTASVRTGCGTLMDKGPRIFTATTTATGFSFRQGSRRSAQGRGGELTLYPGHCWSPGRGGRGLALEAFVSRGACHSGSRFTGQGPSEGPACHG